MYIIKVCPPFPLMYSKEIRSVRAAPMDPVYPCITCNAAGDNQMSSRDIHRLTVEMTVS